MKPSSFMKPSTSSSDIPIVILPSDDEHEVAVARHKVHPQQRAPSRVATCLQARANRTIIEISSDSDEEEAKEVDQELVESFGKLNLGEKVATTTASTQTEISISPKIILEQHVVDMVLKSVHDAPRKQEKEATTCEAPPSPLQQLGLKKKHVSKKMVFGHSYEVGPSGTDIGPYPQVQETHVKDQPSSNASHSTHFKPSYPPAHSTRSRGKNL
ncbi:hypothetical protein L7F22_067581 [Adiantum nelumboides]|nr:hypothetical protein [Adiantum nelumboides]